MATTRGPVNSRARVRVPLRRTASANSRGGSSGAPRGRRLAASDARRKVAPQVSSSRGRSRDSVLVRSGTSDYVPSSKYKDFDRMSIVGKYIYTGIISQVLAGLTTTLSMIPESLAFTFVAGVPPIVGLHAAATMAFFTAIFGSQHGVISGAAGATAVVLAPLCAKFGIEYLFAAVVLSGLIQLCFGFLRFGKFIRLVPQPVMMGFVNGLAIVIGVSQLEQFKVLTAAGHHAWMSGPQLYTMCGLTALTMAIIKFWPKKMKVLSLIPPPLAAILSLTASVNFLGISTRTVGDMASIAGSLPALHLPSVPLNFATLAAIFPTALAVALVGLIETLLTQQLVDEITEKRSETHVECIAQGVGNVATGFLGGMGGCAMIGQSMINVNSGGRNRVSGLSCSFFLAMSVIAGSVVIEKIPLAALVGTMWMLVIDIFDKSTFKRLSKVPKTDSFVVAIVTGITVVTNLAVAVIAGVIVSSLNFAWKSAQRITSLREVEPNAAYGKPAAVFKLQGPLFFGSVTQFREIFSSPKKEKEEVVVLDFMDSRVWDSSALEAISSVVQNYQSANKEIHIRHLSKDCQKLLTQAGDLYDVNVIEVDTDDPEYGIAANYDEIVSSFDEDAAQADLMSDETDANRMSRAIQRQYSFQEDEADDLIQMTSEQQDELRWVGEPPQEQESELRWVGETSAPAPTPGEPKDGERSPEDAWYSW